MGEKYIFESNSKYEYLHSNYYNWIFNKENGMFVRWGKSKNDDPIFSPIGPEILDIEVSTICHGPNNTPCKECYKSNTKSGKNMSLETFIDVVSKVNECGNLTQVAFGVGDIDGNPELFDMMKWCRDNDIVPNITINGYRLTDEIINNLVKYCGAIAVSHYDDNSCFNAIDRLAKAGMKQINIHQILSKETLDNDTCINLLKKKNTDDRLTSLDAIVFLTLKPVGNRNNSSIPNSHDEKYKELISYAIDNKLGIGFDSCGAFNFLDYIYNSNKYKDRFESMNNLSESCESTLFSFYINVDGVSFPCSFTEQTKYEGIDITKIEKGQFIKNIWFGKTYMEFRKNLIKTADNCYHCRKCPVFKLN